MKASATYICPAKGLIRFEAPDLDFLGNAARVAKGLGLDRLLIPVLENCLLATRRSKVAFLDQFARALDRTAESEMPVWIIAPCQRLLGVEWPAPYLVTPTSNPGGDPVYLDGRVRFLRAHAWWTDPAVVEKRMHWLRDLLSAVKGHPAILGWVLLNRELEWAKPDAQAAEFVLKALSREIKEQNEGISLYLGIGWQEFRHPGVLRGLGGEVDGFLISGFETKLQDFEGPSHAEKETLVAVFLGALAKWLFKKEVEVEIGWGFDVSPEDLAVWVEAGKRMASGGLGGVNWLSLCDPLSTLREEPPWILHRGLDRASFLNHNLNPKGWLKEWLSGIRSVHALPEEQVLGFIDLSPEEYLLAPTKHLWRLWGRFKDKRQSSLVSPPL